jgi:hypothetical protein
MRAAVVGHIEWMEFVPVEEAPRAGEIVHADDSWEEAAGGGFDLHVVVNVVAPPAPPQSSSADEGNGKGNGTCNGNGACGTTPNGVFGAKMMWAYLPDFLAHGEPFEQRPPRRVGSRRRRRRTRAVAPRRRGPHACG